MWMCSLHETLEPLLWKLTTINPQPQTMESCELLETCISEDTICKASMTVCASFGLKSPNAWSPQILNNNKGGT